MSKNEHSMVNFSIEQNISPYIRIITNDNINSSIIMVIKELKNYTVKKIINKSLLLKYNKRFCIKGTTTKLQKPIRSRIFFRISC